MVPPHPFILFECYWFCRPTPSLVGQEVLTISPWVVNILFELFWRCCNHLSLLYLPRQNFIRGSLNLFQFFSIPSTSTLRFCRTHPINQRQYTHKLEHCQGVEPYLLRFAGECISRSATSAFTSGWSRANVGALSMRCSVSELPRKVTLNQSSQPRLPAHAVRAHS